MQTLRFHNHKMLWLIMLRKMITLLLFMTTVPMAVFGQDKMNADHIKAWIVGFQSHAQEKWPDTRKHLQKTLPGAVQSLATHLNDFNPSAGGNPAPVATKAAKGMRAAEYIIDVKATSFIG